MGNVSYRKVGGLRFLRVGRLQMSWCVCKAKEGEPTGFPVGRSLALMAALVVLL